ncbi:hypothetical protein O5D80_006573 [Batrachochytrium dendrobatidis]|nr:hypothetical protein O5D80_006573 [Batrachochytrium dendrobatidis]
MCIIAYNMVWYRFRHRGLGQIMTETKQTPYREVCVEGEWDGWGSGKCPRMMSKDTVSKDHVQRHGVQGPCPKDNGVQGPCPKDNGVQGPCPKDNGVRRPRPKDWRIG